MFMAFGDGMSFDRDKSGRKELTSERIENLQ